jgi:hypothetical protein
VRSESAEDAAAAEVVDGGDLGIVGDETQDSGDSTYGPAPNVNTICIFPKNPGKCKSRHLFLCDCHLAQVLLVVLFWSGIHLIWFCSYYFFWVLLLLFKA